MNEKRFVEQLRFSARKIDKDAFIWKTNDRFSLGIPDLWIISHGRVYAFEAKAASYWGGDSKRPVLSHVFSGPQVSVLRQIERAGGFSCGVIQVKPLVARIIHPNDIPANANVTSAELEKVSIEVVRDNGEWNLYEWSALLERRFSDGR